MKKSFFRNGIFAGVFTLAILASCKGKEEQNTDAMSPDTDTTVVDTTAVPAEADTTTVNPDTVMGP